MVSCGTESPKAQYIVKSAGEVVVGLRHGASVTPDHVKANDARVIAHPKVIGGDQSDTVTFATSALKKGESYTFFCTFPGHYVVMKGPFKVG